MHSKKEVRMLGASVLRDSEKNYLEKSVSKSVNKLLGLLRLLKMVFKSCPSENDSGLESDLPGLISLLQV